MGIAILVMLSPGNVSYTPGRWRYWQRPCVVSLEGRALTQ